MRLTPVELDAWFNNAGATTDACRARGDFDGGGGSYPFEELRWLVGRPVGLSPASDGSGRPDNVVCEGQAVDVAATGPVCRCVVLGAGEGSFQERLTLADASGREVSLRLGLTDFLAGGPTFGERCRARLSHYHRDEADELGPRPALWRASLEVRPAMRCRWLALPANPFLHVFSVTLVLASDGA